MKITNQNAYAILQELEHQANQLDKQVVGSYEHMKCKMLQQEITSAMQVVERTPRFFQELDPDVCDVVWTTEDVMSHAELGMEKPITVEQAREVLRFLEDKHDAEYGINWYSIENAIEEVVES